MTARDLLAGPALVTGAAGASGRALVALLESRGHEVHGADLRPSERARHTVCDVASLDAACALVRAARPSVVYHLVGTFSNELATDHRANVLATHAILEAVRREAPRARVLVVGSAAEYGLVPRESCPIAETAPRRPTTTYGRTKALATTLAETYAAEGLDVVIARPFNLKGRGLPRELLPGRLDHEIARYRRGEIREIALGPLDALRDYVTLEDAARAYLAIAERGDIGAIYNVGSGTPTKMRDYVRDRLAEDGLTMDVVAEGAPAGNTSAVMASWADVEKLAALLGSEQNGR